MVARQKETAPKGGRSGESLVPVGRLMVRGWMVPCWGLSHQWNA